MIEHRDGVHVHEHRHEEGPDTERHLHSHSHTDGRDLIHVHDHEASEAHLEDALVAAVAQAESRPGRSLLDQYRPVFTSKDFLAAFLTGALALTSWILSL